MAAALVGRESGRVVDVGVEVQLEPELHQFRHASELTNESKGGYLSGSITINGLPAGAKIQKITLDLVRRLLNYLSLLMIHAALEHHQGPKPFRLAGLH